jgi:hypothetical protein
MADPSGLTLVMLLPLIAWRVVARFRRLIGRQRLSRVRPWVTLAIFPLLVLLLAASALPQPERLGWLAMGLFLGVLLGGYGLWRTRFEPTRGGLYYTPNAHLGIALSLLFVGRIVYRIAQVAFLDSAAPRGMGAFFTSTATLAIFGLLAGYYVRYAIGLVRWRRAVLRAKREREARARSGPAQPGAAPGSSACPEAGAMPPGVNPVQLEISDT